MSKAAPIHTTFIIHMHLHIFCFNGVCCINPPFVLNQEEETGYYYNHKFPYRLPVIEDLRRVSSPKPSKDPSGALPAPYPSAASPHKYTVNTSKSSISPSSSDDWLLIRGSTSVAEKLSVNFLSMTMLGCSVTFISK